MKIKINEIKERVNITQLIQVLVICIIIKKEHINYILEFLDYIIIEIAKWISYKEQSYPGSSDLLGSITGVIAVFLIFYLETIREKKQVEKREKRILVQSILGIYNRALLLSSVNGLSEDDKFEKLKSYIKDLYDSNTIMLLNYYVKDNKIREEINRWIDELDITPGEALCSEKLKYYKPYMYKLVKYLGMDNYIDKSKFIE